MKKELIWPVTILLSAIIIGGSLLIVQDNKQSSIEKQKLAEVSLAKEKEISRLAEKAEEEEAELNNKIMLSACLEDARINAWEYVKLNGTKVPGKDDVYNAPTWVWNDHDDKKKAGEDLCFKKYK